MVFPNQGQGVASTMPGMGKRPALPKKAVKKPALNPQWARQALVAGMKGCG